MCHAHPARDFTGGTPVALTRILLRASRESTNLDLNSLRRFSVTDNPPEPSGRLVALDLGAKRVGVAVSDESQIAVTPLPFIERRSWKDLLRRVAVIIEGYDARGLVIGLPLSLDGSDGEAAQEARRLAENFRRSLSVPVYLQDERLTTFAAEEKLKSEGVPPGEIENRVDSESAALILRDFIEIRAQAEPPESVPSG